MTTCRVPEKAYADDRVSHGCFRVLVALGYFADENGGCSSSYQEIAERCGIDRRRVQAHVKTLEKLGHLTVTRGERADGLHECNHYCLEGVVTTATGGGDNSDRGVVTTATNGAEIDQSEAHSIDSELLSTYSVPILEAEPFLESQSLNHTTTESYSKPPSPPIPPLPQNPQQKYVFDGRFG